MGSNQLYQRSGRKIAMQPFHRIKSFFIGRFFSLLLFIFCFDSVMSAPVDSVGQEQVTQLIALMSDIKNENYVRSTDTVKLIQIDEEIIIENGECFNCHGQAKYEYFNTWDEKNVHALMNPYYVLDSLTFYEANHGNFRCIDCHSADYTDWPHDGELRMEWISTCMDCHEDDEDYADYHFTSVNEEFELSVHADKFEDAFTCWACHDAHSYKVNARDNMSVADVIVYDNGICLNCHSGNDKMILLSDNQPDIIKVHEWLPNQKLHFQTVRCIECHTQINDSLLVAHNIQPKEDAVKRCVSCHSSNSLLSASLYRYTLTSKYEPFGFINPAVLETAYVIGATRNKYLDFVSLMLFGLTVLGIIIHIVLRIVSMI